MDRTNTLQLKVMFNT